MSSQENKVTTYIIPDKPNENSDIYFYYIDQQLISCILEHINSVYVITFRNKKLYLYFIYLLSKFLKKTKKWLRNIKF